MNSSSRPARSIAVIPPGRAGIEPALLRRAAALLLERDVGIDVGEPMRRFGGHELVVVPSARWFLAARSALVPRPFAVWGGPDLASDAGPIALARRRLERMVLSRCQWVFADSAWDIELLRARGASPVRATLLGDDDGTAGLEARWLALDATDPAASRRRFGLAAGPVALIVGSLHDADRLATVLDAAQLAHRRRPELQWLVVGDGPRADRVRRRVDGSPWLRWHPATADSDLAAALQATDFVVVAHGHGHGVRRALVTGRPIVTLPPVLGEPEGRWLVPYRNCVVAHRDSAAGCAAAVLALNDTALRYAMAERCRLDGRQFGIEPIARRLCVGLLSALSGHGASPESSAAAGCVVAP